MLPNPTNPVLRGFISEDPTMPKYTTRLTTDDKTKLEPLLRRLHREAAGREVMLQESRIEIGKPLTFHQLDGLRNAFGLSISRQSSTRVTEHVREKFSSQLPTSSARSIMEGASNGTMLGSSLLGLDAEDVAQEKHPFGESPAELIDMDKLMCDDENLPRSPRFTQRRSDFSPATRGTVADLVGETEQRTCTNLIDQGSPNIQEYDEGPKDFSDGEYRMNNVSILVSAGDKSSGPSGNFLVPTFEHLARFEIRLEPLPGRRPAMKYSPLVSALKIYSMAVTRSDTDTEAVARLNQAANVLRSLRAFDQAFDIYLFIFCHFQEVKATGGPPHPQLVLAAINCARCAQTEKHMRVSNKILQDVQQRLEIYYEFSNFLWVQGSTHPWRYLETLIQRFLPIMTGSSKTVAAETTQDTAYWVACAIAISKIKPVRAHDLVWDSILPFRQEDVLQHFRDCQVIRHTMLNALQKVHAWVGRNPHWLNTHFGRSRWPSNKQRTGFAQALSCFLLEDHLAMADIAELSPIEGDADDHQGFPCDLGGQAVAVIPYVLMEWIQPVGSPSSLLRNKTQPARTLLNGVDEMWYIVRSSSTDYEKYIDLYLKHWGAPTTLKPAEASVVSPDRLRRLAAGTADLMASADVVAAAKAENARNGLSMREINIGQQDIELDIDRLSISSAPTLTESYTSSNSSDYRIFSRLRNSITASLNTQPTRSSGRSSSQSSMRFSRTTGLPSNPSSSRESFSTISSDVTMTD